MPDGMSSYAITATLYDRTASQVPRWCTSLVLGVAMRCRFWSKSLRLQDTLVRGIASCAIHCLASATLRCGA